MISRRINKCGNIGKRNSGTTEDLKIKENLLDIKGSAKEASHAMNAKNLDISRLNAPSYKEKNQREDLRKREA